MLKKIYAKLKSDGIGGFLAEIYYRALPRRLTFFPQLSHHFQSGTGLEIGGPSKGIFGSRGLMPIYPIAENIDNCNFDSGTIWEGKINEGAYSGPE